MNILIVFGTTEGQTRKVSERARDHLENQSHTVDVIDSENLEVNPDWDTYDAAVVAGSVHQERHQDDLVNFAIAHQKQLASIPTAFISISLAAATDEGRASAEHYVDRFKSATGLAPAQVLLLAGALRYSKYDYFKIEIVKHVVMKTAGEFEATGDHEFTDWDALTAFLDDFTAQVSKTKT